MEESEEELKSLLMKVKEESEKAQAEQRAPVDRGARLGLAASLSSSPLLHPHPSPSLFPDRWSFLWPLVTSPGPLRSSPPTTPLAKYLWPDPWTEKSWTTTSSRWAATPSIPRALSPSARPGGQLPTSPSTVGQAAPLRAKSMSKTDLGKKGVLEGVPGPRVGSSRGKGSSWNESNPKPNTEFY